MFDSSLGAAVQPALAGTATADTLDINTEQMALLPASTNSATAASLPRTRSAWPRTIAPAVAAPAEVFYAK
jgi:hypothetical protein